jgi:WD40 repeat protein
MYRHKTTKPVLLFLLAALPLTLAAAPAPSGTGQALRQAAPVGRIVYTADALDTNEDGLVNAADNDIMYSVDIGADPEDGRLHLAGGPPASAAYPRLTEDGEIILCHAFADTNGDGITDHQNDMPFLAVLNSDGTEVTPLHNPGTAVALEADWSPDERTIVFAYADQDTNGDGTVSIADTLRLAILQLGQLDPANPSPAQYVVDFAPTILTDATLSVSRPQYWSDTVILFEARRVQNGARGIYTYDLQTGQTLLVSPGVVDAWNPVLSPDRTRIAAEVQTQLDGKSIWVYNAINAQWAIVSTDLESPSAPTWSPDGSLLAMSDSTPDANLIVVYDGQTTQALITSDAEIGMTAFSPDGDAIAYASTPGADAGTSLNVVSLDGGYAATLTPEGTDLVEYVWSPTVPGDAGAASVPAAGGAVWSTAMAVAWLADPVSPAA